jgi:CheY-like chemotaxis protein
MGDIRLLIVDKEDCARSQLKKLTEEAGYSYDAAIDGIMALKLLRRHD